MVLIFVLSEPPPFHRLRGGKGRKEGGKGGEGGKEEREIPKQDSVEVLRRVGADIIVLQMAVIGQFATLGGTGRKHVFPNGKMCLCITN